MDAWQIAIIVVAVLVAVAIAWTAFQRQRTERLTRQYGPEYQWAVDSAGDQREGGRDLGARSSSHATRRRTLLDHDNYYDDAAGAGEEIRIVIFALLAAVATLLIHG